MNTYRNYTLNNKIKIKIKIKIKTNGKKN